MRIAALYKQGNNAAEIAAELDHLTLAQVQAALTYYHANRAEIEANLVAEEAEYERLAALNKLKIQETASAKFVFTQMKIPAAKNYHKLYKVVVWI